jgi:predicted transposase YbfD/YdcC
MAPIILSSVLEILLVAAVVGGLVFLKWWQKRRRHADFEILLDDIKSRQSSRVNLLYSRLVGYYQQDQVQALNVSKRLIGAEKIFLQQFIEQQMQQSSVAGFYQQLCDLLDSYLLIQKVEEVDSASESEHSVNELVAEESANRSAATELPPTWGDVFD